MKRRAHHVGRLRIRAAAILATAFPDWDVQPEDIRPATGSWRTDWRLDVYRWELFSRLKRNPDNMPVVCGCWQTLTDFVKYGSKFGCQVNENSEIYANGAP